MSRPRALEDVRVVDFSWVRAGPWATRWLGALGAEIIKIEWPENERGRLPSTTWPYTPGTTSPVIVAVTLTVCACARGTTATKATAPEAAFAAAILDVAALVAIHLHDSVSVV